MLLLIVLTLLQVNRSACVPFPIVETERAAAFPRTSFHRREEGTALVLTSTSQDCILQIPVPATTARPDTTGTYETTLERGGRPSVPPFPTTPIPEPTSLLEPLNTIKAAPAAATDDPSDTTCSPALPGPSTETVNSASDATTTASTSTASETSILTPSDTDPMPPGPASSDIFDAPIATGAPAALFQVRHDHPAPRLGINEAGPHQTNKFYGNFNLGSQSAPTYVHPFSVSWAKGQGASASWGLAISHVDAALRVFGQAVQTTGAVKYFLNPVGIQSICLSAAELGPGSTLNTTDMTAQSVSIALRAKADGYPLITFPLVQGMGFVTAIYNNATPVINSGVFFKTVTRSTTGPRPGITKYTIYLVDGTVWHLYGCSQKGDVLDLQVVSNKLAKASKPFDGFVQVTKDPGNAETMIDASAGAYATGVTLSGSVSGTKGTYTFAFQKAGMMATKLLMYALPHHVDAFDSNTNSSATKAQLQTTTKGMATAIIADSWTMVEPNMPVTLEFAPWDPKTGSKKNLSSSAISTISPVALKEVSQSVDQQSNQNSMYFSGKALAKFASICYALNDLLKNPSLAQGGLSRLKTAFSRWSSNKQQFPLYYETAWGGVVSSSTYQTGNSGDDFGNTFYNDHHFHFGYFILTAAIIGYLDPTWLTAENIDYVNTLVRDVANPSSKDKYFPVSRNFDWFHGHSWAHGLYETADGKDQESSSEDAMHAYAIKMWGHVIKDGNMEARGNLMLAMIARSLNSYYLYTADNKVQPANFIGNKVAGILFENKLDHTTYFGTNIEYIQGIHMIPLLPSTKLTRPAVFVKQEWSTYFDNGRVDQIQGGWRGILYANLATVDPSSAWNFFTGKNFDPAWLDGGASQTWYQAYTAAFLS